MSRWPQKERAPDGNGTGRARVDNAQVSGAYVGVRSTCVVQHAEVGAFPRAGCRCGGCWQPRNSAGERAGESTGGDRSAERCGSSARERVRPSARSSTQEGVLIIGGDRTIAEGCSEACERRRGRTCGGLVHTEDGENFGVRDEPGVGERCERPRDMRHVRCSKTVLGVTAPDSAPSLGTAVKAVPRATLTLCSARSARCGRQGGRYLPS